jgi:hypothetical protein
MSAEKQELKDYAGGWIQERKGTDAPAFLKFAFPVIGLFCVAYLVVFMVGEVDHVDRGPLVKALNDATTTSPMLMYIIAILALVYVVSVVAFAIRKFKED